MKPLLEISEIGKLINIPKEMIKLIKQNKDLKRALYAGVVIGLLALGYQGYKLYKKNENEKKEHIL